MSTGSNFNDKVLPVSMKLTMGASAGEPAGPRGIYDVTIPVTVSIPMTPALRLQLDRLRSRQA